MKFLTNKAYYNLVCEIESLQEQKQDQLEVNSKLIELLKIKEQENLSLKLKIANFGATVTPKPVFTKPTITTQAFVDMRPSTDEKCCSNCKHFNLVGVHLGYCSKMSKEKMDNQCCKSKFEKK